MRGDSLRDFYAKVIAVFGLGVLACAGALVDYWPSASSLPRVAASADSPLLGGPLPVPVSQVAAKRPMIVRTADVARRDVPPAAASGDFTEADAIVVVDEPAPRRLLATSHSIAFAHGTGVTLAAPPVVMAPAAVDNDALADVAVTQVEARNHELPFLPPVVTTSEDAGGFFTGAVKKTRDSIVRSGRKAGASIFDAFRFVGSAMKKALPG